MRYTVTIEIDVNLDRWVNEYSDDVEGPPEAPTPATVIQVADVLHRASAELDRHWVRGTVETLSVAVHLDTAEPTARNLIASHQV